MARTRTTKRESYLRQIINAIPFAGVIMFFIGAYYCVVKAGIPYQDPPLELQIEYAVNMGIGEALVKDGLLIFIGGGIVRLILNGITRIIGKGRRNVRRLWRRLNPTRNLKRNLTRNIRKWLKW